MTKFRQKPDKLILRFTYGGSPSIAAEVLRVPLWCPFLFVESHDAGPGL